MLSLVLMALALFFIGSKKITWHTKTWGLALTSLLSLLQLHHSLWTFQLSNNFFC